jgi:hypothetical protein
MSGDVQILVQAMRAYMGVEVHLHASTSALVVVSQIYVPATLPPGESPRHPSNDNDLLKAS